MCRSSWPTFALAVALSALAGCSSSRNTSGDPADIGTLVAAAFPEPALNVVAFGSCLGQNQEQPIWDAVVAQQPDLFVFLGDNVYADTEDMSVMRAKYQLQSEQPGVRKLFASTPVMATWDDHDYGKNDAGAEYPMRAESQREFLEFFAVQKQSPRWQRRGVYHSQTFGPPGKRVQVIVLDTRYFRSALHRWPEGDRPTKGPYRPSQDESATVLGQAQWSWLEARLREPADVRLIGTSIQAIPDEHGFESWANFPIERTRLFDLIRETAAGGVILLSGDRHLADISVLQPDDPDGVGYPLYEVTASSLNRPSRSTSVEPNRYRVHEANYLRENFGTIFINWTDDPLLQLQIRDIGGAVVLESQVRLSELQ